MAAPALRPLSVGEILDVSFGLYRRHFATLFAIVLLCSAAPLLLNLYLQGAGDWLTPARMFEHPWLLLLYWVAALVLHMLGAAATVFVVSESYLERAVAPGDALRRAVPFLGRLVVFSLLFTLLVGIGMVLLFVPGVILACGLIVATPALVIESAPSATAAMGRSWHLTKGARGRIFMLALVLLVLLYIPLMGVGVIAGIASALAGGSTAAAAGSVSIFGLVFAALGGIVQMLVYPLMYCVLTVLYYDLRVRREGFDLEVLAAAV